MDTASTRERELERQTRKLSEDLEAQQGASFESQARFEERVRAVYKGEDLVGLSLVLESIFSGDSARINAVLDGTTTRMLIRSRGSIQFNQDSKRALRETLRQLNQKKAEYKRLREEQRARAEELRQSEAESQVSIGGQNTKQEQMEERIAQLEVADESGEFTMPPASSEGGVPEMQEEELGIASEDIVAREVEPIPYERYVQIYKAAAKRYGFAENWHVLAAVGYVESNHGENIGPSSAGAIGPMQFLPSTWTQYGVDGNRDGDANIMDPEDAIPAAANYLKLGGAPEDWYAALYTYNHVGRYVREVLGVAEAYRQQAADEEIESYV
jgi:soluble lytic murein transglycosylase-like protein